MKFLNLNQKLADIKAAGLYRRRISVNSAQSSQLMLHDERIENFASNDYLGLANSQESQFAMVESAKTFGFGSGASHLVSGHQQPHDDLEKSLADFLGRDAALCFSSGYMANLAILQSLSKKADLILADKLNHASLIDGVKLSNADSLRYQHCDLVALEKRLSRSSQNTFVVTDSVFSMDGDIAPLDEIANLCEKYNAILIVDDAHGFGVLGDKGKGATEYFQLDQQKLPVLMSTLGKALGGCGAAISGEKNLVDYLVQSARNYIYTTALPAAVAAANLANLKLLSSDQRRLKQLKDNIRYFRQLTLNENITIEPSETAIQPLIIGDNEKVIAAKKTLMAQKILVGAIRPPTVPKNSGRLRITLSASHSSEQIERLVQALKRIKK